MNFAMINPIWIVFGSVLIALVPMIMALATSYIKVNIVLGMIRSALGTQQTPSGLVIMAVSTALTVFIMEPVFQETLQIVKQENFGDFKNGPSLDSILKFQHTIEPWKRFMAAHSGEREMILFSDISALKTESAKVDPQDLNKHKAELRIVMPAYVLTELKQAFAMAFVVLLPFLVIDLIVANLLVGLGMYMVSPVMISLPLKLILFVVSDAWILIAKGLIASYQ